MKILAIDTATALCGLALTEDEQLVAEYRLNRANMHNERLVSATAMLLGDVGWGLRHLDCLAVSGGPGSFTGLRIGFAAAKGLAFSVGLPLVVVNTLDALAGGIYHWEGEIRPILKAREGEFYTAQYQDGREVERTSEYEVVPLARLSGFRRKDVLIVAAPGICGEGFEWAPATLCPQPASQMNALTVARLGFRSAAAGEFRDVAEVEPFYLKDFKPKKKAPVVQGGRGTL